MNFQFTGAFFQRVGECCGNSFLYSAKTIRANDQLIDNKPLEKSLVTDKFGVGICMEEIQKELSKENGEDIPEMLIETLLWNGIQGRIDVTAVKEECIARLYIENIRKRLVGYGYKEGLVHLYVIGGGGCLLWNYIELASKADVTYITDTCAKRV